MILICKNCDFNYASKICIQCANDNSSFCVDCSILHSKLKCFKGHNFDDVIIQKLRICSNCESSEAKFECNICLDPENCFCSACSILHSKIKAYRSHSLVSIAKDYSSTISTSHSNVFIRLFSFLVPSYNDIRSILYDSVFGLLNIECCVK